MQFDRAIIIRDKTRLEQLIERFNSKAQARFYIESSGGDFNQYEKEHQIFYGSLKLIQSTVSRRLKFKVIERSFLPTYIFTASDLIIVVGQDGLVANTAKYLNGLPIVAVNPDQERYDGILLPLTPSSLESAIEKLILDKHQLKRITMAEARLNDGQRLLAFNDFYIGASSHVSSRYVISFDGKEERQSSSGIIISTGAGSSGWLSSVFNMTYNVQKNTDRSTKSVRTKLEWDDRKLIFVVREPFLSNVSQIDIGYGVIENGRTLKVASQMPMNGVIFSDGIESDFLHFNSGNFVEIGIAKERAALVCL